ncbi:MAG: molecular chaperone TorD family protein [Coriobacteriales bacterium]|nr:molecular chaperone TorD family protein [Coriobacteriales bacterium]
MEIAERKELVNELIAVNAGRASFYKILAYCYFKELTQQQIETIAKLNFDGMSGDDPLIAEGFEDMRKYLRKMNTGTRQELAVDYAHTFLAAGNYTSFAATPFESVFTSETGLLMQEARDEVYKMYCDAHIQPDESLHTPEDHATFEFEFLAELLTRINTALEEGDYAAALSQATTVQKFHTEHQLNWTDDFCDAIADTANTRFYRGLAKVTRGFVHLEEEVIADEVDAIKELSA